MNKLALLAPALVACASLSSPEYDVVLRGGTIYDGGGGEPYTGDVALAGDRIVALGRVDGHGKRELDVRGRAVAPGFVNMLSWATESLLVDGRALADVAQGITLEVMGEGESMGPLDEEMRRYALENQGDIEYAIPWTTLGEYLEEEGALGIGSSLIYAPAFYAKTDELVALCEEAAKYGGMYISHIRSEGNRLLEAVDELVDIARRAGLRAEIYHLKAAGEANWSKLDAVIGKVDAARAAGLAITADMYTYTAGATGLDAAMPPWVQEGGLDAWCERLRDPALRARVAEEMRTHTDAWENLLLAAGSPERVLLVGFKTDALKPLTGKTLAEVARLRNKSVEETAMDLVVEDHTRIDAVYFLMTEENVRREIALPWVSFCSDAGAPAPEGVFLESNPHPRAYGNFARLLGRYVRDEKLISLQEAVRKLTALPAENLRLVERGRLAPGFFADVVVFDPATVTDHATFERPHQLATGVEHVFVNGIQVLADGAHTGARPGRVVRGPGWKGVR